MLIHSNARAARLQGINLGVGPLVYVPIAAATSAITGLSALLQNNLDDNWADAQVFNSAARDIHAAMAAIQCMVGGAQPGAPIRSTLGGEICPGGTKPVCRIDGAMLAEWRNLRDGFSQYWREVSSSWNPMSPTDREAKRLKDYALAFHSFYQRLVPVCQAQGAKLDPLPTPDKPVESDVVKGLRYGAWIVGGIAFIWAGKLLYDTFKK